MKLNLKEVTSLLGLSTDSVLNHIKKDRLAAVKIAEKGNDMYIFDFEEIKVFASEFLDIDLSEPNGVIKMTGMFFDKEDDKLNSSFEIIDEPKKKSSRRSKKAEIIIDEAHNEENGDGSIKVLKELIGELKEEKEKLTKELSNYKEQAAFQIGQLKSQVEHTNKMLVSGQAQTKERDIIIQKLKKKVKIVQGELEEEKQVLDKMNLFDRIF